MGGEKPDMDGHAWMMSCRAGTDPYRMYQSGKAVALAVGAPARLAKERKWYVAGAVDPLIWKER